MMTPNRLSQSQKRAAEWALQRHLKDIRIYPIEHLSTEHFDFFMIEQTQLRGDGDLYVMSDGQAVFEASADNFKTVLRREGFYKRPSALTALKFAQLYFKMAELRRARVLEDADDWTLEDYDRQRWGEYVPPSLQQQRDHVVVRFATAGPEISAVVLWEAAVDADYNLQMRQTPLNG